MYNIALVCENGASTGIVVKKMLQAAKDKNIDCEIKAYPYSNIDALVKEKDYIMFGPQLKFKMEPTKKKYPDAANKITSISPADFGMMRGDKILADAIKAIDAMK